MSEVIAAETSKRKSSVKYRRPLNKQQVRTLHLLYWYRFCTAKQLAHSFKKPSPKAIQNKLHILEEQQLIGKRYDKSYKLAGRPAEYFITPKGTRALEATQPNTTNQWATKCLYKNKTVSDDFLRHTIAVTDASKLLRALYGAKIEILTKSYMSQFHSYPTWTPDLHVKIPAHGQTPAKHYFVDIWDGTKPFFVAVRKTRNYTNFKESGDWEDDEQFPAILAICETTQLQKKLNRQMKRILNSTWDDELIFATTTKQLLAEATKPTDKIWSRIDVDDTPELTTLRALIPLTS